MIKLIIAGGRDFKDYSTVQQECDKLLDGTPLEAIEILCGEAKGCDTLGRVYGTKNNIKVLSYPARWNEYGKGAGFIRNTQMAKDATHLIAFWDGKSKGTEHMIKTAEVLKLKVKIINY